ncbi:hypothetical protein B566_EDAN007474 [Ephemera danica]|nr:hypothetical protein B566_EDAN007474 [Ephemera danica]
MEDSGIDSDPKQSTTVEIENPVSTISSDSSASSTTISTPRKSTAKELHRKLERRIEQARKTHRAQEYKKSPGLIPIQRDEDIPVHFFPAAKERLGRQELSDTFSIEELELSPDEDDLNLVPPKQMYHRWACCAIPVDWRCAIL